MSRKSLLWLFSALLALLLLSAALVSRNAEAEITQLRAEHKLVWRDYLGVNAQFHFYPEPVRALQMQAVQDLGLEWVRIAMHWFLLEPEPDQFNLDDFDAAAQSMAERGFKPVGFLAGSPRFASSAPIGAQYVDQYPPADPQVYADSLLKFIERYPQFQTWQVWNEPNIYPYWRPKEDAEGYARLLFTTADAVKALHPNMPLAAAGMAYFSQMPYTNNDLMLQRLLEQGLAQHDFIVAYHPYTEEPEGDDVANSDFLARVRFVNSALRAHSIKHIWATEWGWSSYAGPKEMQAIIGTDGQADYTLRRLALMSALDFDRSFLFNLADLPPVVGARDQKYGLLDIDGNPKPVFHALKNFFAVTGPELDPRDPPPVEQMPSDLYSIAWTRTDGKRLWMFWSRNGSQVIVPGISAAQLHDPLTGEQRELQAVNDRLTVPLKSSLQLLVW